LFGGVDAVSSDEELKAKGNSWLKSSNPLPDPVQVTLPSVADSKDDNYSRDSLDTSDDGSKLRYDNGMEDNVISLVCC
jgi:hypothetical protein